MIGSRARLTGKGRIREVLANNHLARVLAEIHGPVIFKSSLIFIWRLRAFRVPRYFEGLFNNVIVPANSPVCEGYEFRRGFLPIRYDPYDMSFVLNDRYGMRKVAIMAY